MFKKVITGITAMLIAFTFASCTEQKEESSVITYNPDEECTITLSWWGGDERHEATQKAVELFEEKYPNINVEVDFGSWTGWKTKVFGEIENNECADVVQVNYDWLVTLSYDGTGFYNLEELGEYIDLSNFSEGVLEFGRRNSILNAIPVSITGRTPFYNKAIFEKVGLDSLPETWDDLFTSATRLNTIGRYPIEADNGSGCTAWYLSIVYEQQKTGKEFITADGEIGLTVEEIADALNFYKTMLRNGVVRNPMLTVDEGNLYESDAWIEGVVAGVAEWGSSVAKYQNALEEPENLVMGNLLTMENAQSTGWFYKPSLLFAIDKNTQYPVQSAMLLDFLYNDKECAEILGTSRGIPVSESAFNALKDAGQLSGLAYDSNNLILESNPTLISPYFENSDMKTYYYDAIEAVSLDLLTPEEAAQGMYANIVYTLDQIKKGK